MASINTLVFAALVPTCLLACDDKTKTAPPQTDPASVGPSDQARTPQTPQTPDQPDENGVTVTLLSAGAEPKQVLRFKPEEGRKETLTIRTGMDVDVRVSGQAQPKVKFPKMVATIELKTTSVAPQELKFEWTVKDYTVEDTPGVLAQLRSGMKAQLVQLVGAKGTGTINAQGRNLGATFEPAAGVRPEIEQMIASMRETLSTMSTPLPAEAVGVGGAWKVTTSMTQNGTKSNVEFDYVINSIDGDVVVLDVVVSAVGVPGPITQGLPVGATASLDSMTGGGKGTLTMSVNSIAPVRSTMDMTTRMKRTVRVGGESQESETELRADVVIEATQ